MKKLYRSPEIEEELRNIAPGLSNLPSSRNKENLPFRYFEKLSDQVIQKLEDQSEVAVPVKTSWLDSLIQTWYTKRLLIVSITSILVIFFIGGLWMYTAPSSAAVDFSQINPREAKSYLLSYADDLDDVQLNLLNDQAAEIDFIPVSDEDLEGVIDDYLYQIPSDSQLN